MKVTALIPDELVGEVKDLAHGKNITDSLITALQEWVAIQRMRKLNELVRKKPLEFAAGFSADAVRSVNRK